MLFCEQVEELCESKMEEMEEPKYLALKNWNEIDHGTLGFDRHEAEVDILLTLSKQDVMDFFQVESQRTCCAVAIA